MDFTNIRNEIEKKLKKVEENIEQIQMKAIEARNEAKEIVALVDEWLKRKS